MVRLLLIRPLAVLALAFVVSTGVRAQTIPAVGSETTLDVATWNIEWFGNTSNGPSDVQRQFRNVRAIIEGSEIDVWGVQEISSPVLFNALLDSLGEGYGGALASYSQTQKIGFIYRTDVISPRGAIRHVLESVDGAFGGRAPLRMEADVTLPDTSFTAVFLTLHMKAGSDAPSYRDREEASRRLKSHLDVLYPTDNVMVLGDFNDMLTGSIRSGLGTPYRNILDDAARYRFITLEAEERGESSFLGRGGSMIDHILITDEWFDAYVEDSARPWSELPRILLGYSGSTSDHLPVYASFDFTLGTSAPQPAQHAGAALSAPYPNPAQGNVRFSYTLEHGSDVALEVFDLTGRLASRIEQGFRPAGRHDVEWSVADLAPGMYVLRLSAGAQTVARMFSVAR